MAVSFQHTHRRTMKVRNRKGGRWRRGGGRRIKRSEEREGNDRESWQGLGERSKRRLSETNHQDQTRFWLIFLPFLRKIRARFEAKSQEILSVRAQSKASRRHVHPPIPASCLPVRAQAETSRRTLKSNCRLGRYRKLSARISHGCYRYCSHLGPESDLLQPALAAPLSPVCPRGRSSILG